MLIWSDRSVPNVFEKHDAKASKYQFKIFKLSKETEYCLTIKDVTDMRTIYTEYNSHIMILLVRAEMHCSSESFDSIIAKIPRVL